MHDERGMIDLSKSLKPSTSISPFFDAKKMKPPTTLYVCWVDVMGSESRMRLSIAQAANFVMKLHVAVLDLEPSYPTIELWPVMDGLYACATKSKQILSFLRDLFSRMTQAFISENEHLYKFCIRAGLAYGPTVKGTDLQPCSDALSGKSDYCKRVLLGIAVSQAYDVTRRAAPFGIALHESTRAFAPPGNSVLSGSHYEWWRYIASGEAEGLTESLVKSLEDYHQWCMKHTATLTYDVSRIDAHKKLVQDYFT